MSIVTSETKAGKPILFGGTTIVPFANSIMVRIPFIQGGLVWNRPVAVAVQSAQDQEYILPIQDVTRQILFALIGASMISMVLIFFFSRKSKGKKE
jgi:hypothetical protein